MNDYWVCPSCRSLNRDRAKECYSCHAPYAPFDAGGGSALATSPAPGGMVLAGEPAAAALPPPVATLLGAPVSPAIPSGVASDDGLGVLGGVVGGAIGAIVSAAVWYLVVTASHIQAGIVAIAVGWIVGQAVVLAAGRRSIALVGVSVAWTLVALVVAQYLIVVRLVNDLLAEAGAGVTLPLFLPPGDSVDLLVVWFQKDPLTLVFWAIALIEAVAIPWRRAMRPARAPWTPSAATPEAVASSLPR